MYELRNKCTSFRVARPTDKLDAVRHFYCNGLGLEEIGSFEDHDGYDGVIIGIPDKEYHLEFSSHKEGSPCPTPTKDNLLVFYFSGRDAVDKIETRMRTMGYSPVEPENPYWKGKSVTFEDPDGWRVVLFDSNSD